MTILDTNYIIRFLTNDDAEKAQISKKLILSEEILFIPDVVFPEIEYVLRSEFYDVTREGIIKTYSFLLSRKNIRMSNTAKKAIELYENSNFDMADCLIASEAILKNAIMASFDQKLLKLLKNEIE